MPEARERRGAWYLCQFVEPRRDTKPSPTPARAGAGAVWVAQCRRRSVPASSTVLEGSLNRWVMDGSACPSRPRPFEPAPAHHYEVASAEASLRGPTSPYELRRGCTIRGTHKGHRCQEGIRVWPGDYARRRAGLTVLLDPSSPLPSPSRRAAGGSSWSARSRAAARTNELDAGKRRKIIEGGEGFGCGWIVGGRVLFPVCGRRSGLTSTHPAPRQRAGGCHDHVSGTGLLSHEIEHGLAAGSCRRYELTRGLATLPSSRPPRRRRGAGCFHVGQQVPGAGQQLAGDRDGGDVLAAT